MYLVFSVVPGMSLSSSVLLFSVCAQSCTCLSIFLASSFSTSASVFARQRLKFSGNIAPKADRTLQSLGLASPPNADPFAARYHTRERYKDKGGKKGKDEEGRGGGSSAPPLQSVYDLV
jgi:hypothetical protein